MKILLFVLCSLCAIAAPKSASAALAPRSTTYRVPKVRAPKPLKAPKPVRVPKTKPVRLTAPKRDPKQRSAFEKTHPCPSTGKTSGACPGYVVDHIQPLACGGADHPSNMQWQTEAAGKIKDSYERSGCH